MTSYKYATDSETGTIEATDFAAACRQLDAMIPPAARANGGWGWVGDTYGDRYEIGGEDDAEYGALMDYHTGECIGEATRAQRDASRAAGPEGVILVDADGDVLRADDRGADDARRCYVQE